MDLWLLRHAKSNWDVGGTDLERTINARGEADARAMGAWMGEAALVPALVLVSPAVRAQQTAALLVAALGVPRDAVRTDARLYGAGMETLLAVARDVQDQEGPVLVVGHNPGLEDLAHAIDPDAVFATGGHVPTCTLVRLDVVSPRPDGGRVLGVQRPEDL